MEPESLDPAPSVCEVRPRLPHRLLSLPRKAPLLRCSGSCYRGCHLGGFYAGAVTDDESEIIHTRALTKRHACILWGCFLLSLDVFIQHKSLGGEERGRA